MKDLYKKIDKFVEREILPNVENIETKPELIKTLLQKAGKEGLLSADLSNLPKLALITEKAAASASFNIALQCHVGISSMPLLFYGNAEQKERYLSRLQSGEMIGAFAVTEKGAGTDAFSLKLEAVPANDEESYVLNGDKYFVTNGAIADLFTVFARCKGEITAFLVERGYKGLKIGPAVEKMGLKGLSVTSLTFDNVRVPKSNLLGEIGEGYKIIHDALNIGRWLIGAGSVGTCKILNDLVKGYIEERRQFNKTLSEFEIIKDKIATMAIKTFMAESAVNNLTEHVGSLVKSNAELKHSAWASIVKVYASEALGYVVDEAMQIFGGYSILESNPVARYYRDCRAYRIFEGTNEINRLMIAKAFLSDEFFDEHLMNNKISCDLIQQISSLKALVIFLSKILAKEGGSDLKNKQTILSDFAAILIEVFVLDEALVGITNKGLKDELQQKMLEVYFAEKSLQLEGLVRQLLINLFDADVAKVAHYEKELKKYLYLMIYNIRAAKNEIATAIIENNQLSNSK